VVDVTRGWSYPALKDVKVKWMPFVLTCFVFIECLREQGAIRSVAYVLKTPALNYDENEDIHPSRLIYLVTLYSFISVTATIIVNKNPATIGFCRLLLDKELTISRRERWAMSLGVMYGLNVGIYFAPFGSMTVLAWLDILKRKGIGMSTKEFTLMGLKCIGAPSLAGILVLSLQAVMWDPPHIDVHKAPIIAPWSGWLRTSNELKSGWLSHGMQ